MSIGSDAVLIQQIRRGDSRAWQQLIDRYEQRLLLYADRRLRDRATSEDVVQETFIGFFNSLPHFDERRELQTYLFSIASNKVTDRIRKILREQGRVSDGADDILPQQHDSHQRAASSFARSDERRDLERGALSRALANVIRHYQDKNEYVRLQVLELLFVKGWANCEVARFLNLSEQQIANFRFAAVKKIKDHVRAAGLPLDVFPELADEGEEE